MPSAEAGEGTEHRIHLHPSSLGSLQDSRNSPRGGVCGPGSGTGGWWPAGAGSGWSESREARARPRRKLVASRWGAGRGSAPWPLLVGPQPPSPGPSPEPERDWWRRLSLGGGRAVLLRSLGRCHSLGSPEQGATRAGGISQAAGAGDGKQRGSGPWQ